MGWVKLSDGRWMRGHQPTAARPDRVPTYPKPVGAAARMRREKVALIQALVDCGLIQVDQTPEEILDHIEGDRPGQERE